MLRMVLLTVFLVYSCSVYSLNRELYDAYQKVSYSLNGGEMRFSCEHGLTQFKLNSKIGSRPKLYWFSGSQWVLLPDVMYDDNRMTFEGMSRDTGLPLQQLLTQIEPPPLFNQGGSIAMRHYFYKSQHNKPVPYIYSINMLNEKMQASNIEPIVDYLRFNARRYKAEQNYQTPIQAISLAQQKQQRREREQRQQQLRQISETRYAEIKVVTPAYEYQNDSRCYLM